MKLFCICLSTAAILMMTACASSVTHSPQPVPVLPASLRAPCPPLQHPDDGTAGAILRWAVATIQAYQVCSDRHAETVQAWPR